MASTAQDKASSAVSSGQIPNGSSDKKASLGALALGSVGVVYGDIGTSPLYALRESLGIRAWRAQPSTT